jgi:hypothetical protein
MEIVVKHSLLYVSLAQNLACFETESLGSGYGTWLNREETCPYEFPLAWQSTCVYVCMCVRVCVCVRGCKRLRMCLLCMLQPKAK